MMMWMLIGLIIYVVGLMSFVSRWKHVLSVMLSLEMMMVGIYLMVVCGSLIIGGGVWLSLIFLGMVVCEGAVGLSLIVSLVRSFGGDCLLGFIGDVGGGI
uniref:NADH-ubiquinone oxidoreductase chain 4L n=1 Tax=Phrynus sp. 1 SEM-2008 TaxID=507471 RepID=B2CKE2_9ARAC|nr:NADH dehydrogenase subunit 4L [Phrynus sp. 1 SEM-2008]